MISSTLVTIDFRSTHIIENHNTGCHGNHVFSHSPYQFIFRTTLFCIYGVPINNLAPMKNCPGGGGGGGGGGAGYA